VLVPDVTNLADRTIAALRATYDDLASLVPQLTPEQLRGPSGAAEWTVAQVLSHMGSGAEIGLASYGAAIDGTPEPGPDFNPSVWDRWNAMSPQEQADGYLESDAKLVQKLESLTPDQREKLQIKLGFLPFPLPLSSIAGMRLNESAQHAWDVHVGLTPGATLPAESAEIMAEQLSGGLSFLPGFFGKPEALKTPAVVVVEGTEFGFVIGDEVALTSSVSNPTATFVGPLEAAIRLVGGRLKPEFTAPGITVTGSITLDDLRRVFPGF
jgi:uncharacterized protein (TIGR03083 family)